MFKSLFNNKATDNNKNELKSSNALGNLGDISFAANKSKKLLEDNKNKFDALYKESLESLQVFLINNASDKKILKNIIIKLKECTDIKKTAPGPYYYLSYISYLSKDIDMANKYYELTKLIDPNFHGLDKLGKRIKGV